jgi:hypothetical protein
MYSSCTVVVAAAAVAALVAVLDERRELPSGLASGAPGVTGAASSSRRGGSYVAWELVGFSGCPLRQFRLRRPGAVSLRPPGLPRRGSEHELGTLVCVSLSSGIVACCWATTHVPPSSRSGSDTNKSKPRRCTSTPISPLQNGRSPAPSRWTATPAATARQTRSSDS